MIGRNEPTPVPDHAREGRPTISEITVRKATPEEREKYGIGGDSVKLTEKKLREWVEEGLGTAEIAQKVGIKEASVRQYAWNHEIKIPRKKAADILKEERTAPEPTKDYGKDLDGKTGYYKAATRADQPEEKKDVQAEIKEEMHRRLQQLPDKPAAAPVSAPEHYTSEKIDTIDFIEDKQLNFNRGNIVNFVSRAGKKDKAKEIEDLRKAQFFLNREIRRLERVAGAVIETC